jgi:DNA-binding MarR family transcriptional regulator
VKRRLREEIKQSRPFASAEEEVFLEIQRTADASLRWVAEALKPHGLSPTQYNVLRILKGAGSGGLASGEIAERMVTRDPDCTRLLDRLERRGLVSRARDRRDRRVVTVRITAAGLRLAARATGPALTRVQRELRHLGPRRLEALAGLLERVRAGEG